MNIIVKMPSASVIFLALFATATLSVVCTQVIIAWILFLNHVAVKMTKFILQQTVFVVK